MHTAETHAHVLHAATDSKFSTKAAVPVTICGMHRACIRSVCNKSQGPPQPNFLQFYEIQIYTETHARTAATEILAC